MSIFFKQILFHVHDTLVCEIAWTTTVYIYMCVWETEREKEQGDKNRGNSNTEENP